LQEPHKLLNAQLYAITFSPTHFVTGIIIPYSELDPELTFFHAKLGIILNTLETYKVTNIEAQKSYTLKSLFRVVVGVWCAAIARRIIWVCSVQIQ
jgi:hypothetical protein